MSLSIHNMSELSFLQPRDIDATSNMKLSVNFLQTRRNLLEQFSQDDSLALSSNNPEHIKVYLRVKPVEKDKDDMQSDMLEIQNDSVLLMNAPKDSVTYKNSIHGACRMTHKFTFSRIFHPGTSQKFLFENTLLGVIKDFLDGQNCLVFTYGATNAGKTYTVQGTHQDTGILPRALDVLFNSISGHQNGNMSLKPVHFCSVGKLTQREEQREKEDKEKLLKPSVEPAVTQAAQGSQTSHLFETSSASKAGSSLVSHTTDDSMNSLQKSVCNKQESFSLSKDSLNDIFKDMENRIHDENCLSINHQSNILFSVWVSFAEIYNECVYDLLERPATGRNKKHPNLKLAEDRKGNIYIKGLRDVCVCSADEAYKVMMIGKENLHFAATKLNHISSRSHCIFTVKVIRVVDIDQPHIAGVNMLTFCDLAGSERVTKTKNTGERLKEAGNINTSLLVLGRCMKTLRDNQMVKDENSKKIVPFREAKLTKVFHNFLNGRGKAVMIVNISQNPLLFDESIQVLRFSAIAKEVTLTQLKDLEKPKPVPKLSRFSQMLQNSLQRRGRSSIPWEKPQARSTLSLFSGCEVSTVEEETESPGVEEEDRCEALLVLLDKLKKELLKERDEKQKLETKLQEQEIKIRDELCKEFSNMVVEIENKWSERVKETEQRNTELAESRITALTDSLLQVRKRARLEQAEDDDMFVSSVLLHAEQSKLKEEKQKTSDLTEEVRHLTSQIAAMKEALRKVNEERASTQTKNSSLQFQLADVSSRCTNLEKTWQAAKDDCQNQDNDLLARPLVVELQRQLKETRSDLRQRDIDCEKLQEMVDEAASEYLQKEAAIKQLREINEESERRSMELAVNVEDLKTQLEDCQVLLMEASNRLDDREAQIADLEEENGRLKKKLCNNVKEWSEMESKMKLQKEESADFLREKTKLLLETADLRQQLRRFESAGADMQARLNQQETHKLKKLVTEQKHQLKILEEELQASQHSEKEQVSRISSELAEARERERKLEAEKQALTNDLELLSSKLVTVQESRAENQLDLSSLRNDCEMLQQEKNGLSLQLSAAQQELGLIRSQLQQVTCKQTQVSKDKDDLNSQLQSVYSKLSDAERRLTSISHEKQHLVQKNTLLASEKTELLRRTSSDSHLISEYRQTIECLEGKVSSLQSEAAEREDFLKSQMDSLGKESNECVRHVQQQNEKMLDRLIILEKQEFDAQEKLLILEKQEAGAQEKLLILEKQEAAAQEKLLILEKQEAGAQEKLLEKQNKIEQLQEEVAQFKQKLSDADSRLQSETTQLSYKLDVAEQKVCTLGEELKEKEKEIDRLNADLAQNQNKLSETESQLELDRASVSAALDRAEKERDELVQSNLELKQQLQSTVELLNKIKDEVPGLEKETQEKNTKLREMADQIARLDSLLLDRCNSIELLSKDKKNMEEEMNRKVKKVEEVNRDLEKQLTVTREQFTSVQDAVRETRSHFENVQNENYTLADQLAEKEKEIRKIDDKLKMSEQECERLQKQMGERESAEEKYRRDVEKKEKECRKLGDKLEQVEKKCDDLNAKSRECQDLRDQLQCANSEANTLKREVRLLEKDREELQVLKQQHESCQGECEMLRRAGREQEAAVATKESTLQQKEQEITLLQKEVKTLLQQKHSLDETVSKNNSEICSLQAEVKHVQQQMKQVQLDRDHERGKEREAKNLERELSNKECEVEKLRFRVRALEREDHAIDVLKGELESKNKEIATLQLQISTVHACLETKELELSKFCQNRNQITQQYECLVKKHQEQLQIEKHENAHLRDVMRKITPRKGKEEALTSEIVHLKEELQKRDQSISHLEACLTASTCTSSQTKRAEVNTSTIEEDLRKEVSRLHKELEDCKFRQQREVQHLTSANQQIMQDLKETNLQLQKRVSELSHSTSTVDTSHQEDVENSVNNSTARGQHNTRSKSRQRITKSVSFVETDENAEPQHDPNTDELSSRSKTSRGGQKRALTKLGGLIYENSSSILKSTDTSRDVLFPSVNGNEDKEATTVASKKRRRMYKLSAADTLQSTPPGVTQPAPTSLSPHTVVRRKLRSRKD